MIFGGLQKLSLIDYPEKVSSVAFTQGCLFRCPYCHNPELVPINTKGAIEPEEILEYLKSKKNFLDGLCITGGEPTMHKDLPEFIAKVKALDLAVKLDTNGTNPKMVEEIIKDRLVDYFAMDLKNPWPKYDEIAKLGNKQAIDNCQKTFHLIQDSGVDHEFRTTVFPAQHIEKDFFEIVSQLKPGEKYYIQNIRHLKTLDPDIDQSKVLDVYGIIGRLQVAFPQILISER